MAPEDSGTFDWYRRAALELAGTSDLQVAWAAGIAADETVVALIDRLPREHRQPSLVFSVARWLGAPAGEWPEFREFLVEEWPRIEAVARERRTQTNEVGRCARCSPRSTASRGPSPCSRWAPRRVCAWASTRTRTGSTTNPSSVTARPSSVPHERCRPGADRLPDIVWRRGIDLAPLSIDPRPTRPQRLAWLKALLPPDRPERLARLRAACATLADDPPEVVAGDAVAALPALAATAPSGATLVIVALGTLVYLPPADRAALASLAVGLGARLVTMEPVSALPRSRLASLR